MKTAKSIIVVLSVLLTAQIASAYYCPSTGRWLSRDPIGEPGFENLRAASALPEAGQVVSPVSLPLGRWIDRDPISTANDPDRYAFVKNAPINLVDPLGLRFGNGKICGNYCGGGYCGGKHLKPGEKCDYSVPATDALDTCCKAHDQCYDDVEAGKTTKAKCDATLCTCSKAAKQGSHDSCGCIAWKTVPIWACDLTGR
jgi:hypothetical protein